MCISNLFVISIISLCWKKRDFRWIDRKLSVCFVDTQAVLITCTNTVEYATFRHDAVKVKIQMNTSNHGANYSV